MKFSSQANQTKSNSVIESITSVIFGFILSILLQPFVFIFVGIQASSVQNIFVVVVFTFIGLIRTYVIRRIFNKWN
jgi:hypothetical protein